MYNVKKTCHFTDFLIYFFQLGQKLKIYKHGKHVILQGKFFILRFTSGAPVARK